MNPYVTEPDQIPPTDRYADDPDYGRYKPKPDDLQIDPQHVSSQAPGSFPYWVSVLDLCNESNRVYPADEGGRDVFALGSIIVKSSHLHGQGKEIDYSYADANECRAVGIARDVLGNLGVRVPRMYFAGKVGTILDIPSDTGIDSRMVL